MKNSEKTTKIEFHSLRNSGVYPSITTGFNAGMAHMYENPVEAEMQAIAEAEKAAAADINTLILSFRSLLTA